MDPYSKATVDLKNIEAGLSNIATNPALQKKFQARIASLALALDDVRLTIECGGERPLRGGIVSRFSFRRKSDGEAVVRFDDFPPPDSPGIPLSRRLANVLQLLAIPSHGAAPDRLVAFKPEWWLLEKLEKMEGAPVCKHSLQESIRKLKDALAEYGLPSRIIEYAQCSPFGYRLRLVATSARNIAFLSADLREGKT